MLNCSERQQCRPLRTRRSAQPGNVQAFVAALGLQYAQTGARMGFPQSHRPIKATAGHELAVAGERHAASARAGVALQCGEGVPGASSP